MALIIALMAVCIAAVVRVTEGDCGKAPQLENGAPTDDFISRNSFPVGTKHRYKCNPGYTFQERSSQFVTCLADSTWTPLRTVCEPKNCGNPGELQHGYYQAANTTFGNKALFYCDAGYQMVGRNYRLCKSDGWDGQVPTCETVTCADPPPIPNGIVTPHTEKWEYGMVATYSCVGDYSLIGAGELSCTATGQWDKDPPKCKVVECQRPKESANIRISSGFGPTYKYLESISYRCDVGYEMVGNSLIECRENNTFVPLPPTCKLRAAATTAVTAATTARTAATTAVTAATTAATKIPPTDNTGRNVGIGVGVVVVVVVAFAAIFGVWRYLKQKDGQYVTSEKVAMNTQSEQVREAPNCDETSNCAA